MVLWNSLCLLPPMSCFGQVLGQVCNLGFGVYWRGFLFRHPSSSTAMANFNHGCGYHLSGYLLIDLFSLNTVSPPPFSVLRKHTVSAGGAINATNARLNAGLGADTISLTAGVPTSSLRSSLVATTIRSLLTVLLLPTPRSMAVAELTRSSFLQALTPPPPSTPMVVMTT